MAYLRQSCRVHTTHHENIISSNSANEPAAQVKKSWHSNKDGSSTDILSSSQTSKGPLERTRLLIWSSWARTHSPSMSSQLKPTLKFLLYYTFVSHIIMVWKYVMVRAHKTQMSCSISICDSNIYFFKSHSSLIYSFTVLLFNSRYRLPQFKEEAKSFVGTNMKKVNIKDTLSDWIECLSVDFVSSVCFFPWCFNLRPASLTSATPYTALDKDTAHLSSCPII